MQTPVALMVQIKVREAAFFRVVVAQKAIIVNQMLCVWRI
jgi:hypothetical protein